MDRKEFAQTCEIIKAFFPKFQENIDSKQKKTIWYEMFEDLEFDVTSTALKKVLAESKYMPTVAEIRQAVANIKNPKNEMTGSEAWGQIRKAIQRFGSWNVQDAYQSMDPEVRKLAKRFGFKDLCVSENIMADRAHFIKLWKQQQEKKQKYDALPRSVKEDQKRIQNNIKMLSETMSID